MSSKLSRRQLAEVRKQAKIAREKELEALAETDQEAYEEAQKASSIKKDKMGFTQDDRKQIRDNQVEINKPKAKVTWNFTEGELVYLPDGEVGIIVQNNARGIEVDYNLGYNKVNESIRYKGKVYVVTSSGNNWYYPRNLKPVR